MHGENIFLADGQGRTMNSSLNVSVLSDEFHAALEHTQTAINAAEDDLDPQYLATT